MDFVGSMNDISENNRGMDFHNLQNTWRSWFNLRAFHKQFKQSNCDSGIWRISRFARCTWIPAIDKATRGKKSGKGPKRIKKLHIVNILIATYLVIIIMAAFLSVETWMK